MRFDGCADVVSTVENEMLISEAFELSCLSYASISSPAVEEL